MKVGMRFPLMIALSLASLLCAQDFFGVRTGLNVNGRYWNGLSVDAKATYIIAATEGMTEILSFVPKDCGCALDAAIKAVTAVSGGHSTSYMELVEGTDDFYKDPTNRAVPVIKALSYVTLKIKGASSKELDDLAAKLRKEANR